LLLRDLIASSIFFILTRLEKTSSMISL